MVQVSLFLLSLATTQVHATHPTALRDLLVQSLEQKSAPASDLVQTWAHATLLPELKVVRGAQNFSSEDRAQLPSWVDKVRLRTYGSIARVLNQNELWIGIMGTKDSFQVVLARLNWQRLLPETSNPIALYTPDEIFLTSSSLFQNLDIREWASRIRRNATDPGRAPEVTRSSGEHYRLVGHRLHGLPLLVVEARPHTVTTPTSQIPGSQVAWFMVAAGLVLTGLGLASALKRRSRHQRRSNDLRTSPVSVRPSFEYLKNLQSSTSSLPGARAEPSKKPLSDPEFEKELLTLSQASSERALFSHLTRITSLKFQTPALFLSFHPGPEAALLHTYSGLEETALPAGGLSVHISRRAADSIVENAADGNLSELSDYEPLKKAVLEHFGVAVFNAWAITPLLSLASLETDSLIAGILVMIHPNVDTVAHQRQLIRLIRTASLTYGRLQGRYRNTSTSPNERGHAPS